MSRPCSGFGWVSRVRGLQLRNGAARQFVALAATENDGLNLQDVFGWPILFADIIAVPGMSVAVPWIGGPVDRAQSMPMATLNDQGAPLSRLHTHILYRCLPVWATKVDSSADSNNAISSITCRSGRC